AGAVISTYAAAAKTLQTFGWPMAIPFMAAAIAAGLKQVAMIKAQEIPSAETGGIAATEGIYHLHPGELITPAQAINTYNQQNEGANVQLNFYAPIITATGLTDRDMDEAAEYFLEKVKDEFGRYGGKLNG
ncbi:unnamed protein product, partial [marine sediment metagenome]